MTASWAKARPSSSTCRGSRTTRCQSRRLPGTVWLNCPKLPTARTARPAPLKRERCCRISIGKTASLLGIRPSSCGLSPGTMSLLEKKKIRQVHENARTATAARPRGAVHSSSTLLDACPGPIARPMRGIAPLLANPVSGTRSAVRLAACADVVTRQRWTTNGKASDRGDGPWERRKRQMFDFLTGVVGLVYFVSISVATRQHFRSDRYPLGMYVISALSLAGLGTFLGLAFRGELVFAGLSLALVVAAQGLFVWAVRHSRNRNLTLAMDTEMQSETIIRTGPWRYMRHPFYASYMIFWLACALATQHIISVIVFLTLSAIYTYAALREERVLSSGPLRKDYIEYRETVGIFYPRLPLRG